MQHLDPQARQRRVGPQRARHVVHTGQLARRRLLALARLGRRDLLVVGRGRGAAGRTALVADAWAHDVGLVPLAHLLGDALPGALHPGGLVGVDDVGRDRRTAPRQLAQRGGLHVAEHRHRDRARDRRGRHDQHVRRPDSLLRAGRPAARRRSGAARRRRPGRGRRTARAPGSGRACRSTMPASPEAASRSACRRAAVVWLPVSRTTRVPMSLPPSMPPSARSPSIAVIDRWCCAARTSVGASSAAWPPASMAASMARSATTVLPEPTSPCSSRCIGLSRGQLLRRAPRRPHAVRR